MVHIGRRFQGKDGSLPDVRKERLGFRKAGVMKRPWVQEKNKSSRNQTLGKIHTGVLFSPCSIGSSVCLRKYFRY